MPVYPLVSRVSPAGLKAATNPPLAGPRPPKSDCPGKSLEPVKPAIQMLPALSATASPSSMQDPPTDAVNTGPAECALKEVTNASSASVGARGMGGPKPKANGQLLLPFTCAAPGVIAGVPPPVTTQLPPLLSMRKAWTSVVAPPPRKVE